MRGAIHLWANTSAWWWAVQSKAFSRDGDADGRQSRGLQRPAGSILKWRVGYRWHASAVSMAHTSHELRGWTVRLAGDSTTDELRRHVYLGPPGKSLTLLDCREDKKSNQPRFLLHFTTCPFASVHSAVLSHRSCFCLLFLNGLQTAAIQRWRVNKNRGRNKQTEGGESLGPFMDTGAHLAQNDPWIRGHGLAALSKLLYTLKIKPEMNGAVRSIDSGLERDILLHEHSRQQWKHQGGRCWSGD